MSVRYHNWQADTPSDQYATCSPNLFELRKYLAERWGLTNLGCFGRRPIRGGTSWSSHSFGAAHDYSYRNGPDRSVIESEVIPFLVDNFEVLGIQRVHDYWARRYWHVGKGWIGRPPGARNDHLHVEVTPETWHWATPISDRLGGTPPPSNPVASSEPYPGQSTKRGSSAKARIRLIQQQLIAKGENPGPVDGMFGRLTEASVRRYQAAQGLTIDGIVGPQTWRALFS